MGAPASREPENLSLTLVSAPGSCQVKESFVLMGAAAPTSAIAQASADVQQVVFSYLGDIVLKLVFATAEGMVSSVRMDDLVRMQLTPTKALALAFTNFKHAQGPVDISTMGNAVYSLRSSMQDSCAVNFLDRAYWRTQLTRSEPGVLMAMPRRGCLMFAYANDPQASQEIQRLAQRIYYAADEQGLSAYVYCFTSQGWQIHATLPAPDTAKQGMRSSNKEAKQAVAQELALRQAEDQQQECEEWAAQGQKTVIRCLLVNFLLNVIERSQQMPWWLSIAAAIVVNIFMIAGLVKLCSGLQKTQSQKLIYMVLSFVPLLGVAALVYLSMRASQMLRAAGWSVGLLGAKL